MSRILIGVDVCKDFLDAHARPAGLQQRFANDPAGIAQLVAWARALAPHRVVFESTGPYQKAAVGALLAAGLPAVVVNARQVRDFAKGTGQLAKTDAIDAGILAHFRAIADVTDLPMAVYDIPSRTVVGFQIAFEVGEEGRDRELFFNVANIFNERPPAVFLFSGGPNYERVGRSFRTGARLSL